MKNNMPNCSVIVSVYKDIENLDLILESLSEQTVLPNEVIVSEDGECQEVLEYIKTAQNKYTHLMIRHSHQEDIGWRKNRALNRAIVMAEYEYLIFIDGDCVPYSTFIEAHLLCAEKNIVLCGKRIELGEKLSLEIKKRKLKVSDIERNFFFYLPKLLLDKARHPEDGIPFKYNSWIAKQVNKRYVRHILGCNFSCYKDDFLKINGFDETFVLPCEGEDVDPSWRFREVGIELKSCRCVANIAHIYHKKRFGKDEGAVNRAIMEKNIKENNVFCKNGIIKQG